MASPPFGDLAYFKTFDIILSNFHMKNLKKSSGSKAEETSWDKVAIWYDENIEKEGSYQKDLILPNIIRLMSIKKDEKILDIACGQGFFSREFARAGGLVSAFDISPQLINIAKNRENNLKINYSISSSDKMFSFKDNTFDKATIILAIQDIEKLGETMSEASRVLKNGGELFMVINHPTFRIPKKTSWGFDEEKNIQFRRVDEYISEARIKMDVHPGRSGSEHTTSFHRPLQTYFKVFQKNGFVVTRLEEWVSNKESEPGPRAIAENKARREFPLFMAMVLKKLNN